MNKKYSKWLRHVFDHEFDDWHFDIDAPEFILSPDETVELITALFENSGKDLNVYSDYQVNGGINYIINSGSSNYLVDSFDPGVSLVKKRRLINSIFLLYRDCFSKRCAETLSSRDEEGGTPLNSICYMFWDINAEWSELASEKQELDKAKLHVLTEILSINHRGCREGALHGLGHEKFEYPREVETIITDFLTKTLVDEDLKNYAKAAMTGMIQ